MAEKRGYSLFELTVVMAIMVAMLGIATIAFHSFGRGSELKASTRVLAGALRTARSHALTRGRPYSVLFDTENERYWIEDSSGMILDKQFPLPEGLDIRDVSGYLFNDKSGDGVKDPDEDITITFKPTGTAVLKPGGSIHIARATVPLVENNDQDNPDREKCYTVTVTVTGKVTLYYYGRNNPWYSGPLP